MALDTTLPDRTDHEHEISYHHGTKRGSKDFGQATEMKGIPRRLMNLEQGFTVCTSVLIQDEVLGRNCASYICEVPILKSAH